MQGLVFHANDLLLENAEFRVRENARQQVIRERRKVVHAGVRGIVTSFREQDIRGWQRVRYNPYEGPHFVRVSDGSPVFFADKGKVFARGIR